MRWSCMECRRISNDADVLTADNPFGNGRITGCVYCHSINSFERVCDEPGCDRVSSCGWPNKAGKYRRTCMTHMKD